eukprot:m.460587 g.460587  ORF g.460587 m.460587 type:complete len:501 (-) comp22072_c0_seq1:225-1727(-)
MNDHSINVDPAQDVVGPSETEWADAPGRTTPPTPTHRENPAPSRDWWGATCFNFGWHSRPSYSTVPSLDDTEDGTGKPSGEMRLRRRLRESAAIASWVLAVVIVLLGIFGLVPAYQPFQPSPMLLGTLVAWWAAEWFVAIPLWLVWAACAVTGSRGRVTPRGALYGAVLLAISLGWVSYVMKNRGGGLDAADSGELALCVKWCESPFKPCEDGVIGPNLGSANVTNPDTAANAISFFREYVHGDMPIPMTATLTRPDLVELTVNNKTYPYIIQSPGRDTLLLAVDKNPITQPGVVDVAIRNGWSAIKVLVADTGLPGGSDVQVPYFGYGMLAENAAVLTAIAKAVRQNYTRVAAYGCSVGGKVVYWSVATSLPNTITDALIDSGGALGPSSFKAVGPCGETFAAMVGRHGNWLARNASSTPPPQLWPYDVGDLILDACKTTRFRFGVSRHDQWNNWVGTIATAERARSVGCQIDIVEGYRSHCGHFFGPGSCTQRCVPPI